MLPGQRRSPRPGAPTFGGAAPPSQHPSWILTWGRFDRRKGGLTPSFPLAFCIILWIMPRDALSELLFLCCSLGWVPPAQLPYPHPTNHAELWLNDPSLLRSSPCLERKPCLAYFPGPVFGVWPVVHGESANGARIFQVPPRQPHPPEVCPAHVFRGLVSYSSKETCWCRLCHMALFP